MDGRKKRFGCRNYSYILVPKVVSSIIVPKPVEWNYDQVFEWAQAIVPDQFAQILKEQYVDGESLLNWSKEDEKKVIEDRLRSIGIPLGPAAKLAAAIKKLSETPTGTP